MAPPKCGICGALMKEDESVCTACGKPSVPQHEPETVEGQPGVYHCFRHRKEHTRLRCGRCARAICTKCAVIGPAGPRCPICSKNTVPFSARAVAHEAKVGARRFLSGPYQYLWILLAISLVTGLFRSCAYARNVQQPVYSTDVQDEPSD